MGPAAAQENLTEHTDGVLGQIGLSEQFGADVVVADEVPAVDGELVA